MMANPRTIGAPGHVSFMAKEAPSRPLIQNADF
jgi:hypothetical protein